MSDDVMQSMAGRLLTAANRIHIQTLSGMPLNASQQRAVVHTMDCAELLANSIRAKMMDETLFVDRWNSLAPAALPDHSYEQCLRAQGWQTAAEVLAYYDESSPMRILAEISPASYQEAADCLTAYKERPAFYNVQTGDLYECGTWDELRKMTNAT